MMKLLPQSLFGQTLVVLLAGLVVSHLIGAWVYTADREQAVRAVGGMAAAQRIANITQLMSEAPADWRDRLVTAVSDPTFRVTLSTAPLLPSTVADQNNAAIAIGNVLAEELKSWAQQIRVRLPGSDAAAPMMPGPHVMMMDGGMHVMGSWRDLQVSVLLNDGQWLSFATMVPKTGPAVSWQFIVSMALMGLVVLVVSIWAIGRVTAPLAAFAQAATALGKNLKAEPVRESGTREVRQATRAFNDMQTRLIRLIEGRTRMLAAISHDLRTPLTLLRLRAESAPECEDREKMLATINEMNGMIGSVLDLARSNASLENRRPMDLTALVESIVDDMKDAGFPVTMQPSSGVIYECYGAALKRAVTNLIDNAVKYGRTARVAICEVPTLLKIIVEDEGPGIPEHELGRVTEPFYRVEESRSRESGGAGLGLAIAVSVIEAHGGELKLANRREGGLRAEVRLPR